MLPKNVQTKGGKQQLSGQVGSSKTIVISEEKEKLPQLFFQ